MLWLLTALITFSLSIRAIEPPLDPFQESFEGWHHQQVIYDKEKVKLSDTEKLLHYKTPFLHDEMEVAFNFSSKDRDLVVVVPGIFASLNSVDAITMGLRFYKRGFNVLRFSNPVSNEVVSKNPKYAALDFESEAAMIAGVILQLRKEHRFPKIHLVGNSYGGFLSAVASVKLGEDFNGKLLLLSPPRNIYSSLKVIDSYFDELQHEFDEIPWRQIWLVAQMKWARLWGQDTHLDPKLAKSTLVIYGFHRSFIHLSEVRDAFSKPPPWYRFFNKLALRLDPPQYQMRFVTFLREFNPAFFVHEERHDLFHWLDRNPKRWRLFSADNDFILEPHPWPSSEQIVVFHNGAHGYGFWDRPEFVDSVQHFF